MPRGCEGPELPETDYYWKIGWDNLCMAVIIQAAKDKAGWFFLGEDFQYFTSGKIDGPALWKQIQENYETYGSWCQPLEVYDSMRRVYEQYEKGGYRNATW